MPDLSFSQAERRSFTVPALLGLAVLAVIAAIFFWRTPMRAVDLTVTHTNILPTHTVFPTATRMVGVPDPAEDAFYVLATVHIHNDLHVPIFLKDITGTLTTADDSAITSSAVEKNDLPNLYVTFPKLKPLSSTPLLRESTIQPGADAEGMVILEFPIDQQTWDKRKSATLTVDLYHQGQFTTEIPRR
ncbi:MAG TPA: hypothetical protein VHU44_05905 [Acidobacteriaceae bacterium]|jgi:hypothetical protein|nr:hypothetical protein [Acidobacteriaceae bacterium]